MTIIASLIAAAALAAYFLVMFKTGPGVDRQGQFDWWEERLED